MSLEYKSRLQGEELDALFDAVLQLRDRADCYRFFEDVCSVMELNSISQRWQVARMLDGGQTYQEIAQQLAVSTATISRVNRCLAYGAGGYRLALERMKEKE